MNNLFILYIMTQVPLVTELNLNPSDDQLRSIKSPSIISIMRTIKRIQQRMKDPDIRHLEYIRVYDQLGREFDDFFNRYTQIFISVIRGEDLKSLASVLYYKDQVLRGLVTEQELSDKLAKKYFTTEHYEASKKNLEELKRKGEI